MNAQELKSLLTAQGPFVSIYFDDSRDTAEAEAQLQVRWQDLRRWLEDAGADEGSILRLQRAVLQGEPAVGRQGRGVIATRDGVLINEHLATPPASVVRVSEYPYLLPLIELSRRHPPYVFAAVDHVGADITLHDGGISRSETVEGGGYPVHKPVTAGWNGYGDVGHSVEEAVRMNVRAIADRLTELVDKSSAQVVFVCGEVRSRTDVVSELPDRVAKRVCQLHAGAQGHRVREPEIAEAIDAEFTRLERAAIAEVADRFTAEIRRGSGLATEGLAGVCHALRDGSVEMLIVGDLGDATVVTGESITTVAPDADALSELGDTPRRVVRADEALPFAAIAVGASLVAADMVAPVDGIAALLRYAPPEES